MASIYLRGRVWWCCYYDNGRKFDVSLKTKDRTVAKFKKNEIENKLAMGESPLLKKEIPLSQVYDEFFTRSKGSIKPATTQYYKDLLAPFVKSLPPDIRIHKVKSETIDEYISAKIDKSNIQPGMVWHILKALKTFFNFAVREKYLFENPIKRKKPKLPKRIPECWTNEEVKRIIQHTKGTTAGAMIYFNLYFGLRPAELLRLNWNDIDWKNEVLTVQEAKDNEFRKINIHPAALKFLKDMGPGEGLIFQGMNEGRMAIEARRIKKAASMTHIKRFWYAIRHTFATRYYEKTRDLRGLQEILGHSKIEMTTVYANPSEDHRKEQIRQVEYDGI